MSDGIQQAQDQRNFLERLVDKIPGFKGFQNRELRRDVDKLQREHLSEELERLKGAAREKARAFTDAGEIAVLGVFDRLDRRLDGLSQAIRFADYGQSGFFDAVKVGEAELERLYQFDLSLLDDLAAIGSAIAALPSPGGDGARAAVDELLRQVGDLDQKWARRKTVVSEVVQT